MPLRPTRLRFVPAHACAVLAGYTALFLLVARHGSGWTPPAPTGTVESMARSAPGTAARSAPTSPSAHATPSG